MIIWKWFPGRENCFKHRDNSGRYAETSSRRNHWNCATCKRGNTVNVVADMNRTTVGVGVHWRPLLWQTHLHVLLKLASPTQKHMALVSSTVVKGLTFPLQSVPGIGSDVEHGSVYESSTLLCFVPPGLTALPTSVKGGSRIKSLDYQEELLCSQLPLWWQCPPKECDLRSGHWPGAPLAMQIQEGCWLQFQVCPPPHSSEGRTAVEYQWISFPLPQATGCNS